MMVNIPLCLDANGPFRHGIYKWALPVISRNSITVKILYPIFWGLMTLSLCQECQTLIDNHDQIKLLSNARNNLNTTLKDVSGMMSISVEAAAASDSLKNDKELVNTYERLTALDGKRRFTLAATSSHKEEAGRLRQYFGWWFQN